MSMRAGSPLESLDPADILSTVYRTEAKGRPKDTLSLAPTWFSADLSAFAGQTVRLRIAAVANQELLTAGVDAVSIDHPRPGQKLPPLGSNQFRFGKLKLNSAKGTATLAVIVPGPGRLSAKAEGTLPAAPKAKASKARKPQALIKPAAAKASKSGTVKLTLKPTAAALKVLKQEHKLRVKVKVNFAPVGGNPETANPARRAQAQAVSAPALKGPDAAERSRTFTGSRPHGPEPCASTSSATAAGERAIYRLRPQGRRAPRKQPQTRNR